MHRRYREPLPYKLIARLWHDLQRDVTNPDPIYGVAAPERERTGAEVDAHPHASLPLALQQPIKLCCVHRLRQVMVEARLSSATLIRFLAPARDGNEK